MVSRPFALAQRNIHDARLKVNRTRKWGLEIHCLSRRYEALGIFVYYMEKSVIVCSFMLLHLSKEAAYVQVHSGTSRHEI